MKGILYLIPLIFILSCAKEPPPLTRTEPIKQREKAPIKSINVFNAPFGKVWSATLQGLKWMKWNPAFVDEEDSMIRLKEAYVYTKSGKLFRNYRWPSKEEAKQSDIDNYLEKVAIYNKNIFDFDRPLFSQENMTIKVIKLSKSQTKVDVNYKINLHLASGKLDSGVKSSGYIESLLFEQIGERLNDKPQVKITNRGK
ncbi:MAG: hypothetical protein L0Y68_02340 [Candidatus Dadabacteria bacterium]|nr:hypothetical protein [Candidatus Dadabacteria bacterium]